MQKVCSVDCGVSTSEEGWDQDWKRGKLGKRVQKRDCRVLRVTAVEENQNYGDAQESRKEERHSRVRGSAVWWGDRPYIMLRILSLIGGVSSNFRMSDSRRGGEVILFISH